MIGCCVLTMAFISLTLQTRTKTARSLLRARSIACRRSIDHVDPDRIRVRLVTRWSSTSIEYQLALVAVRANSTLASRGASAKSLRCDDGAVADQHRTLESRQPSAA